MREIREVIFRGKRTDCEAWAEGDLLHYESGEMAICKGFSKYGYEATEIIGRYKVIPETVGQYTGLTDKNGVRIFEGDIVRYAERRLGGEDVSVAFPVTFDEGGFCAHHYFLNNWLRNGLGGNTKLEDIEVIGNIHDNPELLKGGEDNG